MLLLLIKVNTPKAVRDRIIPASQKKYSLGAKKESREAARAQNDVTYPIFRSVVKLFTGGLLS